MLVNCPIEGPLDCSLLPPTTLAPTAILLVAELEDEAATLDGVDEDVSGREEVVGPCAYAFEHVKSAAF